MEDLSVIPADEYRFHVKSNRTSIDFVTTVGERWRRSFERLREPSDLARWFVEAGLLDEQPSVSARTLDEARDLREAIYRTAKLAGKGRPAAADLEEINRWAERPSLAPSLSPSGAVSWSGPRPARAALAWLARDAIDLLGGPLARRVKECAADDCALLFVDVSRPGTRRWCTMDGCGNRTKTKAYRSRLRERQAEEAR
jgi:predicted RNA-binding Zn ribbon-like protein